ncbi:MAG: helix-turn-helix domain-containing protein, partial [Cyclobacteriaceae bacterium]|nr:helix-turn-helix domain-containing protein [Cyclobacteriaceae bacterium]
TFEKAIIDVGQAFADGQVYVALSRLRSLDGLILRAPINPGAVSTNKTIVEFSEKNNQPHTLPTVLQQQQERFVGELLFKTFDFEGLEKEIRNIQKGQVETSEFTEKSMKPVLTQLLESLDGEKSNTHKFRTQLRSLLESKDTLQLLDRLLKGTQYYKNFLQENLKILLRHTTEMRKRKRVKTYLTHLTDLDQLFSKKLEEVDKSLQLTGEILQGNVTLDFISQTEERARNRAIMLDEIQKEVGLVSTPKKKKRLSKKTKGNNGDTRSTHEISLDMLKSGLNVSQIAKERSLVVSTIEGHLAKAVKEKRLSIYDFIMEEDVSNIEKIINELPQEFNSKELFNALDGKFSYGQLRAVMAHLGKESTRVIE